MGTSSRGDHEDPITIENLDKRFLAHMNDPFNVGTLEEYHGAAELTGQCGDSIGVQIRVEGGVIRDIRVQPKGCAYTLVSASALSLLAGGKTLDQALEIEPEDVARELGGLPEDHMHCARLAVNTLGEAVADQHRPRPGQTVGDHNITPRDAGKA